MTQVINEQTYLVVVCYVLCQSGYLYCLTCYISGKCSFGKCPLVVWYNHLLITNPSLFQKLLNASIFVTGVRRVVVVEAGTQRVLGLITLRDIFSLIFRDFH